jgi:hypothetical protein
MRYNRDRRRLRCTRILTGVFWRAIKIPADDKLLPGPEGDNGCHDLRADRAAGTSGKKMALRYFKWVR